MFNKSEYTTSDNFIITVRRSAIELGSIETGPTGLEPINVITIRKPDGDLIVFEQCEEGEQYDFHHNCCSLKVDALPFLSSMRYALELVKVYRSGGQITLFQHLAELYWGSV